MSEETKRADIAGPLGMVGAVVSASLFGWFLIVALLMSIRDYEATLLTPTGFPVTQILLDNFSRSWTLVLMSLLLVACWFCGLATLTATSRLIYALSRDHVLVRRNLSEIYVFYNNDTFVLIAVQPFMANDSSSILLPNIWCLALVSGCILPCTSISS